MAKRQKRGKICYVPRVALECLGNIEQIKGCKGSAAFKEMAKLSNVGLEFEKMRDRFLLQDLFKKKR